MRILGIDTSTDTCSAAVLLDETIHERTITEPRRHAEALLELIDELLAETGQRLRTLDALAFGRGPGSFTGLRIAAGVAQGLALGAELAVVPVSSLAALAAGCAEAHGARRVIPALDARMDQIYVGAYALETAAASVVLPDAIADPDTVRLPAEGRWHGAGSGWSRYRARLGEHLGGRLEGVCPDRYPHARAIARLGAAAYARGEYGPPEAAVPVYLREQVTTARRRG